MPELPVKDVRLPELHLPEIDRDEIVRSLSEIPLPKVDLSAIELPKVEAPAIDASKIELPRIDLSAIDVEKMVAGVAAIARIGRPMARRSRWPLAIGAIVVVGLAAWVVLGSTAARERAGRTARTVRERIDARFGPGDRLEIDADVPVEIDVLDPTTDPGFDVGDIATSIEDAVKDEIPTEVTGPA